MVSKWFPAIFVTLHIFLSVYYKPMAYRQKKKKKFKRNFCKVTSPLALGDSSLQVKRGKNYIDSEEKYPLWFLSTMNTG